MGIRIRKEAVMPLGTVWLEAVFAENTVMNLLIVLVAGRINAERPRFWRYTLCSLLCGLYACLMLLPFGAVLAHPAVKIGFSLGISALAWRIRSLGAYMRSVGAYFGISMVGGGTALAAQYLGFTGGWTQSALVLTAIGAVGIVVIGARTVSGRAYLRPACTLYAGGKPFTALIDTGNLLREPLSGLPVVLGCEALQTVAQSQGGALAEIPCVTALQQGTLRAWRLDNVRLRVGLKTLRPGSVYVANAHVAQGYDALVGVNLLQ